MGQYFGRETGQMSIYRGRGIAVHQLGGCGGNETEGVKEMLDDSTAEYNALFGGVLFISEDDANLYAEIANRP